MANAQNRWLFSSSCLLPSGGGLNPFTSGREVLFPHLPPTPYSSAPRSPVYSAHTGSAGNVGHRWQVWKSRATPDRLPAGPALRRPTSTLPAEVCGPRPRPHGVTFSSTTLALPLPLGLVPSEALRPLLPCQALTRRAGLPWYCGLSKHLHRFS